MACKGSALGGGLPIPLDADGELVEVLVKLLEIDAYCNQDQAFCKPASVGGLLSSQPCSLSQFLFPSLPPRTKSAQLGLMRWWWWWWWQPHLDRMFIPKGKQNSLKICRGHQAIAVRVKDAPSLEHVVPLILRDGRRRHGGLASKSPLQSSSPHQGGGAQNPSPDLLLSYNHTNPDGLFQFLLATKCS